MNADEIRERRLVGEAKLAASTPAPAPQITDQHFSAFSVVCWSAGYKNEADLPAVILDIRSLVRSLASGERVVVSAEAISATMLRLRHLANEAYYHDHHFEAEAIRDELAGWLSPSDVNPLPSDGSPK